MRALESYLILGWSRYRFTCVAISSNGLTGWRKPMLDLVPFTDGMTNTTYNRTNIIGGHDLAGNAANIMYDSKNKRFIAFQEGFSYISDDGFTFTAANCRPVKNGCVCGPGWKQSVPSCRHLNFSAPNGVYYDPETALYDVFFRTYSTAVTLLIPSQNFVSEPS